jgi:hypothetical protein
MDNATRIAIFLLCLGALIAAALYLWLGDGTEFKTVEGVRVPSTEGIHEAYSVSLTDEGYHRFTINVSAQNIPRVYKRLSSEVCEPGFFLLEVGSPEDAEKELRKNDSDPFHKDVYYLDGITREMTEKIFSQYENLLVNDGMISFGFGSHEGRDEVYVGAYKVFRIYADEPDKYIAALAELGLPREEDVKTVWQTITRTTPGRRETLEGQDETIWDMIDDLKKRGLYFAERRED